MVCGPAPPIPWRMGMASFFPAEGLLRCRPELLAWGTSSPWGLPFARRIDKTLGVTLFSSQPHGQQGSPASPLPGPGAFLPLRRSAGPLWGDHPLLCGQDIRKGIFSCGGAAFLLTPLTPKSPWRLRRHLFQIREVNLKVRKKKKRNVSPLNHKVGEILFFFPFKMRIYNDSHFTDE